MVQSMVVGLDGSVYSRSALELGIRWAQRWGAVLVGVGIIDAPTIRKAQPRPLGAIAYKAQSDKMRLVEAYHTVAQFLRYFRQRCSKAGVTYQVRQEVGSPAECLLLETLQYDLIVLGQQTFFHFATQDKPDATLSVVVKQSPCPVVAVPATLPEGRAALVAYDGSPHVTRALHMFQALGLASAYDMHVVCIDAQQQRTACWAKHAMAFLRGHTIVAQSHALVTSAAPAQVLLEQVQKLDAGLIVMGAYSRSIVREFFGTSLTRSMLDESPVPLFLYH
jgi:nucleotide-binding universal stress UspA family protein